MHTWSQRCSYLGFDKGLMTKGEQREMMCLEISSNGLSYYILRVSRTHHGEISLWSYQSQSLKTGQVSIWIEVFCL